MAAEEKAAEAFGSPIAHEKARRTCYRRAAGFKSLEGAASRLPLDAVINLFPMFCQ